MFSFAPADNLDDIDDTPATASYKYVDEPLCLRLGESLQPSSQILDCNQSILIQAELIISELLPFICPRPSA